MIETVGDLLKVLHRYPSATRFTVGTDPFDVSLITGEVLNAQEGEIILVTVPLDDSKPEGQPKKKRQPAKSNNDDATEALEQCDHILEMCDEVPTKGEDFAESIREKVESIAEWIQENEHVTPAQQESLNNMERGVSKWIK